MSTFVNIDKERLTTLVRAELELNALYAAGVDSWNEINNVEHVSDEYAQTSTDELLISWGK